MRVVFMGTPSLAATILEDLAQHHEVAAVYTRPDAVRGRGKQLVPSPVKQAAQRLGIEVRTPRTLRDAEVQAELTETAPDVVCVAAYGALLPQEVLDIPRNGCLNVHASLLPRWRGAAPVERAILAGDAEAGVCIMRMEAGLDTGDYCVSRAVPVGERNAEELTDVLANLGSQALLTALAQMEQGALAWMEQDEERVTYAAKIEKGELDPHPADTAEAFVRKVRASSGAHPARCLLGGRGVTVLRAAVFEGGEAAGLAAGALRWKGKRLIMGCADGAVELKEVKPDGKQAMAAASFAAGMPSLRSGDGIWEGRNV